MKKIVFTLIALISMTMTFAANEKDENAASIEKYRFNMSTYALNLSQDQIAVVEDINKTFAAEMMNAAISDKSERDEKIKKAIKRDLSYMFYVLNQDQYREYVKLLNVTLNNRGLSM